MLTRGVTRCIASYAATRHDVTATRRYRVTRRVTLRYIASAGTGSGTVTLSTRALNDSFDIISNRRDIGEPGGLEDRLVREEDVDHQFQVAHPHLK